MNGNNISKAGITIFIFVLIGCQLRPNTNKELKSQEVPNELQNRTWKLIEINSSEVLGFSTTEFNQSKGTDNCPFTFQFGGNGDLLMTFKDYKFKGTYLIDRDQFKYLYCGYNMKIVWNITPECKITPTQLALVFGGQMQYILKEDTLMIIKGTGQSFKLSTTQ